MVDVKLDVGDSPSLKAGSKKNSGIGICRVLMYLFFIGCVTILALDAAELISLGIVSGVMGLKVMKAEDFASMTSENEEFKNQLAVKDGQANAVLIERDRLKEKVDKFTGEVDNLKKAAADKDFQIEAAIGEKKSLKDQLTDLSAERDALKKAAADTQKKIDAVTVERDTLKKQLEKEQLKSDQLKKQIDQTEGAQAEKVTAEKVAEAVDKGDATKIKKDAGKE